MSTCQVAIPPGIMGSTGPIGGRSPPCLKKVPQIHAVKQDRALGEIPEIGAIPEVQKPVAATAIGRLDLSGYQKLENCLKRAYLDNHLKMKRGSCTMNCVLPDTKTEINSWNFLVEFYMCHLFSYYPDKDAYYTYFLIRDRLRPTDILYVSGHLQLQRFIAAAGWTQSKGKNSTDEWTARGTQVKKTPFTTSFISQHSQPEPWPEELDELFNKGIYGIYLIYIGGMYNPKSQMIVADTRSKHANAIANNHSWIPKRGWPAFPPYSGPELYLKCLSNGDRIYYVDNQPWIYAEWLADEKKLQYHWLKSVPRKKLHSYFPYNRMIFTCHLNNYILKETLMFNPFFPFNGIVTNEEVANDTPEIIQRITQAYYDVGGDSDVNPKTLLISRIEHQKDVTHSTLLFPSKHIGAIADCLRNDAEPRMIGYKYVRTSNDGNCLAALDLSNAVMSIPTFDHKCRADKAVPIWLRPYRVRGRVCEFLKPVETARSCHDPSFWYRTGEPIFINNFNRDLGQVCCPGVHFFFDPLGAVNYQHDIADRISDDVESFNPRPPEIMSQHDTNLLNFQTSLAQLDSSKTLLAEASGDHHKAYKKHGEELSTNMEHHSVAGLLMQSGNSLSEWGKGMAKKLFTSDTRPRKQI